MTILSDLVNSKDKPKQQLEFIAQSFYNNLSQREVITLTGILLRLVYHAAEKNTFKIFTENDLPHVLLIHVLQNVSFPVLQQSKGGFVQSILQAYHLEQNLLDKKQEVLRNQVLANQFELDLKYQEIEMATSTATPREGKQTLAKFKMKYKIAKKALKLSQLNLLQTLSQLAALKQKIKESLRQADDMLMILLAPLYDECHKKNTKHAQQIFFYFLIHLISYQAELNQVCPKAALPLIQDYLKIIMKFPDKIFAPFLIRLKEAMATNQLVYLNQETMAKIKEIFEKSQTLDNQGVQKTIAKMPAKRKGGTIFKELFWSNFLTKRNALYN